MNHNTIKIICVWTKDTQKRFKKNSFEFFFLVFCVIFSSRHTDPFYFHGVDHTKTPSKKKERSLCQKKQLGNHQKRKSNLLCLLLLWSFASSFDLVSFYFFCYCFGQGENGTKQQPKKNGNALHLSNSPFLVCLFLVSLFSPLIHQTKQKAKTSLKKDSLLPFFFNFLLHNPIKRPRCLGRRQKKEQSQRKKERNKHTKTYYTCF